MARSLLGLMLSARRSARLRGHQLGNWEVLDAARDRARTHCRKCGMGVDIIRRPAPNEIDVAGQAVALNCQ